MSVKRIADLRFVTVVLMSNSHYPFGILGFQSRYRWPTIRSRFSPPSSAGRPRRFPDDGYTVAGFLPGPGVTLHSVNYDSRRETAAVQAQPPMNRSASTPAATGTTRNIVCSGYV